MRIGPTIDRTLNGPGPFPGLTDAEIDALPYAVRVRQLEARGMTTSDAQGVADLELEQGRDLDWDFQLAVKP